MTNQHPRRAEMSRVKRRVRSAALLLREFTIADLTRASGLNASSVRTEVQRMKEAGFLTAHPRPGATGGESRVSYRLTDDPTLRLALSRSVDDLDPAPVPAPVERPTSRHYADARRLLAEADATDGQERRRLLDRAETALAHAAETEGGRHIPKAIDAHLEVERAYLALLRGDPISYADRLAALRGEFSARDDADAARRVAELRLRATAMRECLGQGAGGFNEKVLARALLSAIGEQEYLAANPLTAMLLDLVGKLAETPEEMVLAALVESNEAMWREQDARFDERLEETEEVFSEGMREMKRDLTALHFMRDRAPHLPLGQSYQSPGLVRRSSRSFPPEPEQLIPYGDESHD